MTLPVMQPTDGAEQRAVRKMARRTEEVVLTRSNGYKEADRTAGDLANGRHGSAD